MGVLDAIGDEFSELTGFGGKGNPDPHNVDDASFEDYYNKAIGGINAVGTSGKMPGIRAGLEGSIQSQLDNLDNNAAGRKQDFMEDSARGFSADVQNRSRAAGGTGNMAQVMNAPGSMYDSEARARQRGLTDLSSRAVQDIGALTGSQNAINNQDFQKANANANLGMRRIDQRTGIAMQNASNMRGSDAAGAAKRSGTIAGIANMAGGMFAKGGVVDGENYAKKKKLVPGKAKVPGDSLANDTVNAKLSPGEAIVPRSVMLSDDPVGKGAEFLAKIKNKGPKARAHFDDGGIMGTVTKLAPLALMLLNKGGKVPGYAGGGGIGDMFGGMMGGEAGGAVEESPVGAEVGGAEGGEAGGMMEGMPKPPNPMKQMGAIFAKNAEIDKEAAAAEKKRPLVSVGSNSKATGYAYGGIHELAKKRLGGC